MLLLVCSFSFSSHCCGFIFKDKSDLGMHLVTLHMVCGLGGALVGLSLLAVFTDQGDVSRFLQSSAMLMTHFLTLAVLGASML